MLSLFFTLLLVTAGVCLINFSSLNLTENELKLLYAEDEISQEQGEQFSQDPDKDFKDEIWGAMTEQMEESGVDLDKKRSREEAIRLTKEIYKG